MRAPRFSFRSKIGPARSDIISAGLNEGVDRQTDTYFKVPLGRLKFREGRMENSLIYYKRENRRGPKESDIPLYKTAPGGELKALLSSALGVKTVVSKKRKIYFLKNAKFHLDEVKGLGAFAEIEAIGKRPSEKKKLLAQCRFYMKLFGVASRDLVTCSYSDMRTGRTARASR